MRMKLFACASLLAAFAALAGGAQEPPKKPTDDRTITVKINCLQAASACGLH